MTTRDAAAAHIIPHVKLIANIPVFVLLGADRLIGRRVGLPFLVYRCCFTQMPRLTEGGVVHKRLVDIQVLDAQRRRRAAQG